MIFFSCFTTFFNHDMTYGGHFPTRQSLQTSPTACERFRPATGCASNDNPESGWSADKAQTIHKAIFSACLKAAFLWIWITGFILDICWEKIWAQGNRMCPETMLFSTWFSSTKRGRRDSNVANVYNAMSLNAFFSLLKRIACWELWVALKIFLLLLRIAWKVKTCPPVIMTIIEMIVIFSSGW